MNTGKQINAMVVVLFLLLIAIGVYAIWDPFRSDTKQDKQDELTLERASTTFALNCRVCHGDRGQGGSEGGRLAAALPLDREDLRGFDENSDFTLAKLENDAKFVANTITCGRAGTAMPIWGQSQGGTLTETQIDQLTFLISEGAWDYAQEHANEIDAEALGHITLQSPDGPVSADANEIVVSNASKLSVGQYIRIPIDEETEERMRILPLQLVVQRAQGGSEAADHDTGATITVVGAPPLLEGENAPTLGEEMDNEQLNVVVRDLDPFAVGNTIVINDEQMAVTAIERGMPTTGEVLVRDIGREPGSFLASGSEGIEAGAVIRMGGELMEVTAVRDDGDPGVELAADLTADASRIAVSDPAFFHEHYVVRIGDELIEVRRQAPLNQLLSQEVGRAETTISVTGSDGITEGVIIRMGSELLRVTEIVSDAQITLERAQDGTAAVHAPGTAVLKQVAVDVNEQPIEDPDTGQTLLGQLTADATTGAVTATTGISVGQTYVLEGELVEVTATQPAVLRVERGVEGTEAEVHARRVPIYDGNLLDVERGVQGTAAAAHSAGDELFMTEVEIDREAGGTKVEDHAKNSEIFLGSTLIVARGVLSTEAAEHEDGAEVLDFPVAPGDPATTGTTCGQPFVSGGPTSTPGPTVAGATNVLVSLLGPAPEYAVTADQDDCAALGADRGVPAATGSSCSRVLLDVCGKRPA